GDRGQTSHSRAHHIRRGRAERVDRSRDAARVRDAGVGTERPAAGDDLPGHRDTRHGAVVGVVNGDAVRHGKRPVEESGLGAACTPARVLVNAYPQTFDDDPELVDRVLRAFVTTVIPGAAADDPDLVRALTDPDYPFAQFAAFFAADLTRRGERRFGEPASERLTPDQRAAGIR